MNSKNLVWLSVAALVALGLWFWSWCQPEKQVRRAQGRLIAAIESRDFDAMAALLAHDYRDRWEHDKANVLTRSREVFRQFALLGIAREDGGIRRAGSVWILSEKIRITGIGTPVAIYARNRVNGLNAPFEMTWRKRGWKPWDWELVKADHGELQME